MDKETKDILLGCLGLIFIMIIILVIGSILNGWALVNLWAWFIIPVFQLPSLSIPEAIGIGMIISFLSQSRSLKATDEGSDGLENLFKALIMTFLILIFSVSVGWVVFQFV